MKLKIFEQRFNIDLEEDVNRFASTGYEILDVKFQVVALSETSTKYVAFVFYI